MAAGDSDTVAAGVRLGEPSRRQRLAGPAVVVLLVGAVAVVHAGTQRAGGDPGGAVLRALEPVARDVPAGAGLVSATHHDAVWSAVCPDNPTGRPGVAPDRRRRRRRVAVHAGGRVGQARPRGDVGPGGGVRLPDRGRRGTVARWLDLAAGGRGQDPGLRAGRLLTGPP